MKYAEGLQFAVKVGIKYSGKGGRIGLKRGNDNRNNILVKLRTKIMIALLEVVVSNPKKYI